MTEDRVAAFRTFGRKRKVHFHPRMFKLPLLMLVLLYGVAESSPRNMTSLLFDLTRDAMELIPALKRQSPSESDQKETLMSSALKKLDGILGNIRKSDRYDVSKITERSENGGSLISRITESLKPVLNPLRIMTSHVVGNRTISKILPEMNKE